MRLSRPTLARKFTTRLIAVGLLVTAVSGMSGCSVDVGPAADPRPLAVGAGVDPQLIMAARIYRATLAASGAAVAPDIVVADDAEQLTAMSGARRDLFPAYSGALLATLVPPSVAVVTAVATNPSADFDPTYVALNKALPQGVSLADPTSVVREPLPGEDVGGLSRQLVAVFRSAALSRDQLKAINKVAGELTTAELATLTAAARTGDGAAVAQQWVAARSAA